MASPSQMHKHPLQSAKACEVLEPGSVFPSPPTRWGLAGGLKAAPHKPFPVCGGKEVHQRTVFTGGDSYFSVLSSKAELTSISPAQGTGLGGQRSRARADDTRFRPRKQWRRGAGLRARQGAARALRRARRRAFS